jgi:DNA polymerase-1
VARIIQTENLSSAEQKGMEKRIGHQTYNGLDACVTKEITLSPSYKKKLAEKSSQIIYNFERALQGPAMHMMLRGMRVDSAQRDFLLGQKVLEYEKVEGWINRLADAMWGQPLNPRSNAQLQDLFYKTMGLPIQYAKRANGEKTPTTGIEALEKLKDMYLEASPMVTALLKLRDISKQMQVLNSGIDQDMRLRCSFNVAATETGRWSSSKNAFGGGTNFQNLNQDMRMMLISDPGMKICTVDLSQAESFAVGYYANDQAYIDACNSGDLHTFTCRLIWTKLPWTGDLKRDKQIAEKPYYRHMSYRDAAKRGGHLTNYIGGAFQLARSLRISQATAEEFQANYFTAYAGISRWHHWVAQQLTSSATLTTVYGRRRQFLGRPTDKHTLREAVAYLPQSTVVETVNLALYRIWKKYDLGVGRCNILGEVHDEIVMQYYEDDHEFPSLVADELKIPLKFPSGKIMTIPSDVKVGYVWNKKHLVTPGTPAEREQKRPSADLFNVTL